VINAAGVIAHTNLGRSPVAHSQSARAQNLEFDLRTGQRGSRQAGIGQLVARACGAESAMVVNNNAAGVMLVLAALAHGRDVAVSRGESVEIGGGFRVPEVMEQSGARLLDVGTTNRTRLADYRKAIDKKSTDVALVLKVHPSNYRVEGFVEETLVDQLSTLGVTVVSDIGSGLLDAACPWLSDGPPSWLNGEPAAKQTLAAGADLVTFSGDKLMGGPQSGFIVGRRDLVDACAAHPLARALRPGGLVLSSLHNTLLSYLARTAQNDIPFWRMATTSVDTLRTRAQSIVTESGVGQVVDCESLPGAGSAPGITINSVGVSIDGDHLVALRNCQPPIIARVKDHSTILDLRTVDPSDDAVLIEALKKIC
jgi:L-seryl-tRNA(Ser) seleniumtransferase